jgi:hypothetical protein
MDTLMILNTVRQFGYVCGFLTKLLAIIVAFSDVPRRWYGMWNVFRVANPRGRKTQASDLPA